jgi:phenylacetate-coenzyme A ligase PaaK-like adenylate-forming protein
MHRFFLSFLIKKLILKRRLKLIELKKNRYKNITTKKEIYEYQVEKFNKIWNYCITKIPFYIEWQKTHNLPNRINSIEELKLFPVLTKQNLHKNQSFILKDLDNYYLTSTGGTSGVTLHFPTSKKNADEAYVNAYLGRSWWGVNPLDKILMFWGHSHLFGKGVGRIINQAKRVVSDLLINTRRISSYSLDVNNVKFFYKSIVTSRPKAIISYSSNVFKICKYMKSRNIYYNNPQLQGVILTSETVTKTDVRLIEEHLNTSVINEYGMAETGPIAYSYNKTDNIRVFWDDFILTSNKKEELILTTIGNVIFPLINYSSEDLVKVKIEYKGTILFLSEILGKIRDVLNISMLDGSRKEISTIFFDHVLKFYPDVYSIHYQQSGSDIKIFLTSDIKLDLINVKRYMSKEISKEFSGIDYNSLIIAQVDEVEKTIAGKNKTLINS